VATVTEIDLKMSLSSCQLVGLQT